MGRLPAELDFLCKIYCGWNKPNMTQAQFSEVQRTIENFPADDLKKIKSKLDLKNLRTELSKLNMDQTFLKILTHKYNLKYPNKYSETGPNTTPTLQDTEPTVKIKRLILQNGDNILGKTDNFILTSALKDKHAIFEMFNINIATLESQLTGLFEPLLI